MSLEQAFQRLSLRPVTLCRQCRRPYASSTTGRPQQSATVSFADNLQSSHAQSTAQPSRPTSTPVPSPTGSLASGPSSFELTQQAVRVAAAGRRQQENMQQRSIDLQRISNRKDLEQQLPRKWKAGDVYAPHDLSGVEMSKWKKIRRKPRQRYDIMDQLGINPLDHYKNFSIMSEYVTEMGRIKHNRDTSLRPVNQRRMAKAIRRAMGVGLIPGVHRHPEILRTEMDRRGQRY